MQVVPWFCQYVHSKSTILILLFALNLNSSGHNHIGLLFSNEGLKELPHDVIIYTLPHTLTLFMPYEENVRDKIAVLMAVFSQLSNIDLFYKKIQSINLKNNNLTAVKSMFYDIPINSACDASSF